MQGYNENTNLFYYMTEGIPGGMNTALPLRALSNLESPYIYGGLTSFGHIKPGFESSTELWAGTFDQPLLHFFRYYGVLDTLIILGSTRAWSVNVGAPVVRTPAVPFTVTSRLWKGQTLVHNHAPVAVVNNHGLDRPHYWDGGAGLFTIIPNSHFTRSFCSWLGRMLTGNVFDVAWYVNRLWWSAINNITDYTTISSGFLDLPGESDPILQLEVTSGNVVVIFRRNSIYFGAPNAMVENPIGVQLISNKGIRAPNSVQQVGNNIFYLSDKDIQVISGYEAPTNIGTKIRKELFKQSDPDLLDRAWSFLDKLNNLYYLVTTLKDATTRAWIYNYEQQSWSTQDLDGITALGVWHA